MDEIRILLELIDDNHLAKNHLPGVFHILIGRRISKADGTVISTGLTWRQLAGVLKVAKFDKKLVNELGTDPDDLAPRDREKMWYLAIGLARVDSVNAIQQADQLVPLLKQHGYIIGPSPTTVNAASATAPPKRKK
ncbi:hypothetical protein [Limnoglobus roseus]|uniref:Uncharacterized protein n=1 Tax=Limnoglobus roseus TaxID=2598579 RepID=A0A5C1AQP6_9BACT|nr:hypothetical protein [Limnoglobus roseus]QEL19514.1 hypothetical protein PX52LOC_06589 [Limnoglobus roseus]